MSKKEVKVKKSTDRLLELEDMLKRKKNRGHQLYWIKYNPGADFDYDIKDATEEIQWMIYEIKRLREENNHYKEFMDSYNDQIKKELN